MNIHIYNVCINNSHSKYINYKTTVNVYEIVILKQEDGRYMKLTQLDTLMCI